MLRGDLATRFGFGLRLAYRKRFGLPAKASIWCGVPGETCVSDRFRTSRRRQWRLRREQNCPKRKRMSSPVRSGCAIGDNDDLNRRVGS